MVATRDIQWGENGSGYDNVQVEKARYPGGERTLQQTNTRFARNIKEASMPLLAL